MLLLKYQTDTRDWLVVDRESGRTIGVLSDDDAAARIERFEELIAVMRESRIAEQIRSSHRRQEIDMCETTVERLAELTEGL